MKREMMMTLLSALAAGGISAEGLTQEQLDSLLKELAQKPAPKNLLPGATCYKVAMPPERKEYVCSGCSAKTIFKNDIGEMERSLDTYRRQIQQINNLGLDATLDERSMCAMCRAKMKPSPEIGDFFIEMRIGGKTTRTKIEYGDFPKLIAFLEKKDKWTTGAGSERPLKDELPRIRELLGMPGTMQQTEYVCPVCNANTRVEKHARWMLGEPLEAYRRQIHELQILGLDATLDERALCATCRANMEPAPKIGEFFIKVRVGTKITRTQIEDDDFPKLAAFLKREDYWNAGAGQERPMKNELPRIWKLLGAAESEKPGNR